ncbi:MAG: ribosome small subunit-dependent GTPase A [Myxococcota bacterium]|nr:ribosome small subunit-dependent GTPase A [Myxococcota bacterium]
MNLKDRRSPKRRKPASKEGKEGRVVETVGRRVRVRDQVGDRICFLSGHRAVINDRVWWTDAPGTGGKITGVIERENLLRRLDVNGRERLLASNLAGMVVVVTPKRPDFNGALIDRYLVAASMCGIPAVICLNKVDLEIGPGVAEDLRSRSEQGFTVLHTSTKTQEGLDALKTFLSEESKPGHPFVLVGLSGVGKTSLVSALLPEQDVGPVGELSEHWEQGRHTTTHSRIFELSDGGELCDSPGIRTFSPSGLSPADVKQHFPGMGELCCQFRDCLHQVGQLGCEADKVIRPSTLSAYRRLLDFVTSHDRRVTRS